MAEGMATVAMADAMLNGIRGTSFSFGNLYVQLHVGAPGVSGTSNVSVGSTTRLQVSFAAPSGGSLAITGTVPEWTNGGTSETLTHASVWSAATDGTFYWSAALSASKLWVNGQIVRLTTMGVTAAPLAS